MTQLPLPIKQLILPRELAAIRLSNLLKILKGNKQ